MIKIDLVWAMALGLGIGALLVFVLWAFYNFNERVKSFDDRVEQCPYCTHVFFIGGKPKAVRCPRCESFLTQSQEAPAREGESHDQ